jgi:hypothetical protein
MKATRVIPPALILALAALAVPAEAGEVGACAFRSESCGNDGDSGNDLCAFEPTGSTDACVPYQDCPPKLFGCHANTAFGAEAICVTDGYDVQCYADANLGTNSVDTRDLFR